MTGWAIVAIPAQDDNAWKASSEKVPHLTILYLGEQSSPELASKIGEFVAHASGQLTRFGLSANRRGVLGDDQADVLFFDKNFTERIAEFRASLLQNHEIKRAYLSTYQYPEWTPHLTLGYPDAPARETEHPIQWVSFDRIALWTGDFSGPEYLLEEQSMAQSEAVENFLAHYGVKGMKWGVRRANSQTRGPSGKTPKQIARQRNAALKKARKAKRELAKKNRTPEQKAAARKQSLGTLMALGYLGFMAVPAISGILGLAKDGAMYGLSNAADKRKAAAGAKAAADIFSDSRGLTNYKTVELAFDAARNSWG